MKYEVEIKKTSDMTNKEWENVIRLKQQHWHYDMSSQRKWIKENLRTEDLNVLLYAGRKLIGYLNIVQVGIQFDSIIIPMFGVGNVCVHSKMCNQGYGILVMGQANFWSLKHKQSGILLCKDGMSGFYLACGWERLRCQSVVIGDTVFNGIVMTYNLDDCAPSRVIADRNF